MGLEQMDDIADLLLPARGSVRWAAQLLALLRATNGTWEDAAVDGQVFAELALAGQTLGFQQGQPPDYDGLALLEHYRLELLATGAETPWLRRLLAFYRWQVPGWT